MSRPLKTTLTPAVVGLLSVGLLRHWRMVEHDVLAGWLGLAKRAIEREERSPDAIVLEVTHFDAVRGYDKWSATYDDHGWLIAREQGVLESLLPDVVSGRALDAGCGTGRVTELLSRRGYDVVGVDQSEAMLARARSRDIRAEFLLGTLESLPVGDAGFDLVVCCLAITHTDPHQVLRELARATRPGGRIVITDVHPFSVFLGTQASFRDGNQRMGVVPNTEHPIGAYIEAAHQAGLDVTACIEPPFRESDVALITQGYESDYGPGFVAACQKGLVGLPMLMIWDLRKPATASF